MLLINASVLFRDVDLSSSCMKLERKQRKRDVTREGEEDKRQENEKENVVKSWFGVYQDRNFNVMLLIDRGMCWCLQSEI